MYYSTEKIILIIFLMSLVTYIPRCLPLIYLSRRKLPPLVKTWLSYVPVAVLAALLGPLLLVQEGKIAVELPVNPYLWAALPSFAAAFCTKNMFITVLTGMGVIAALRAFFL